MPNDYDDDAEDDDDDDDNDEDDDDDDDERENDANKCLMMRLFDGIYNLSDSILTSNDDNDDGDGDEEEEEEEDDDDEEDPSQRPTIPAWSGQLRLPQKRRSATSALQSRMPLVLVPLVYCKAECH